MLSTLVLFLAVGAQATQLLDRNLAYRSPFINAPHLSLNTKSLEKRFQNAALGRRQTQDASPFKDEHYFTFFGGNFSNAQVVWSGGVNFTHRVASGDPLDTSVLLWTRAQGISPAGSTALPDQSVPVCVSYKIFNNPELSGSPADSGSAFTSYDVDWTLKVEATGLQPDTKYWFQFADCTNPASVSPIGATRTFASSTTPADEVNGGKPMTFAVFSCSQFQAGWFNAYGVAAQNTSADVFIHLGDYIYEFTGNGANIGRVTLGRELATIKDYRQRLNQYRTDDSLACAHQHNPWITVWVSLDDHEVYSLPFPFTSLLTTVADNAWKAGTTNSNDTEIGCSFSDSGACFTDRKLAAIRAYHEWMPIRQVTADDKLRIWRNFQIGKLLDLTMLDTRNYDRDITDLGYNRAREFPLGVERFIFSNVLPVIVVNSVKDDEGRSLMGVEQETWFYDTLSESQKREAVWRIVGQQIVFSQLINFPTQGSVDLDAWDGYRKNRARVFDHLSNRSISNTVILSGDSHDNWVSDLARPNDTSYDEVTGNGAFGVEFGGTAVTSPSSFGTNISPTDADVISRGFVAQNPELQWTNPNLDHLEIANFIVRAGENKLSRPVAGGAVLAGIIKAALDSSTSDPAISASVTASA
ncbi:Alkaline phosphatase D [Termitomyces sp. J132]|nr:Alkaline phosphatase D [Termitomyces sp. J132]